jgi:hypothetical protein
MKRTALTIATALLISLAATAQNAITDWNDIGITAARASTAPGSATAGGTGIYMAYVHLAAYNAVNAIDGRFQPYEYSLPATPSASPDAAVVEASYRTLLYLLPDQAAFLTAQYNSSLAAIPDGDAKTKGQMLGLASANALIALRTGDGRGASVPYTFPAVATPGVWILTPGATAPQTPWVGQMRPFTFDDPARFLPDEPPPDLGSQTWADDYNQVKTLGALNSTVRTAWQTEVGRFWLDHASAQYGRMLRAIAGQRKLGLSNTGRLFAMAYSASADSFIGCMNAKYHFSFGDRLLPSKMETLTAIPIQSLIQAGCLWLLRPTIRSIRPPTDASRAHWRKHWQPTLARRTCQSRWTARSPAQFTVLPAFANGRGKWDWRAFMPDSTITTRWCKGLYLATRWPAIWLRTISGLCTRREVWGDRQGRAPPT